MTNHCGTCTACCRVFEVPEVQSKAGDWCKHCAVGEGCTIYDARPATCREFECLWLMSQSREDPHERLPPALRPDRCKVVFSPSTNENIMAATILPNAAGAIDNKSVLSLIHSLVNNGGNVVVGYPRSTERTMFTPQGAHKVYMTEPDQDGMQWNIPQKEQR